MGIPVVMSHRVMRVRDSDFGVRPIRLFAADHERNHPSEIGLEGQNLQVIHQPGVFLECGRDAVRPGQRWQISRAFLFPDLNATLDITNGIEILGKLCTIAWTEAPDKVACRFVQRIQNAFVAPLNSSPFCRIGASNVAEEAVEYPARIVFHGYRRCRTSPTQSINVGATPTFLHAPKIPAESKPISSDASC